MSTPMPIDVAIGIVLRDDGQLLICRRRPTGHLGGFWEFPGGKREPDESSAGCLARELAEEVAITATVTRVLPTIEHAYPERVVRLHPFLCRHESGHPRPLACDEVRWIAPRQLRHFRFPEANAPLIEWLIETLTSTPASATSPTAPPAACKPPDTAAASPAPENT
jgi:A/G-specific adenine glycosylase